MNEFRESGSGADLPDSLAGLPWAPGENFLGLPLHEARFGPSSVVVLPVPYEATVSYMSGTRFGPRGILHASRFIELYDHELDSEPYDIGVHTLPELMLPAAGGQIAMKQLRSVFDALGDSGKFVVMIGGEHSISSVPILAHAERSSERLSVLQLDAHADLRDEYEGTPYSHACVMRRVLDSVDVVPVGIRSVTTEEMEVIRSRGIPVVYAHELGAPDWIDRVVESLGERVYVTVDVDYFDPSLMPATGTPEPGGGSWYPTLQLLEEVFRRRTVVGCDVVELAPIPGLVAPDFTAAKLVYKLIGFLKRHGVSRKPPGEELR